MLPSLERLLQIDRQAEQAVARNRIAQDERTVTGSTGETCDGCGPQAGPPQTRGPLDDPLPRTSFGDATPAQREQTIYPPPGTARRPSSF